jgi:alkanesulfonate monooxygenase SsuD/methylene tetrahydromethanopterin reductase-like flavin-dependent oxidoreductase (luciferase family)
MTRFGFCAPVFAGAGDAHARTPLVERLDYDQLERAVQQAEALGYDSVWVADHLILGREGAILEGWTVMAALARVTKKMRLGSIHFANRFRPPSLTAKMVATLDFMSGGRVDFFFDPYAGSREDADAYGFHTSGEAESFARFEEALDLIQLMWREDHPTHQGKYYDVKDAICTPRPVQSPVPLWIGTFTGRSKEHGARVADLISQRADWWNITPATVDGARAALDDLKAACGRNGRDYGSVRKSLETQILVAESESQLRAWQEKIAAANPKYGDWKTLSERFVIGDVKTVSRRLRDYTDLGIECFMFWFMDYPSTDGMRLFAEKVMPDFQ